MASIMQIPYGQGPEEDNLCYKMGAAVPIIGVIVSNMIQSNMATRIHSIFSQDGYRAGPLLAHLVKIKNDYKKCDIIRNGFTTALIIIALALAVIYLGIPSTAALLAGGLVIGISIVLIALGVVAITRNNTLIGRLSDPNNIARGKQPGDIIETW